MSASRRAAVAVAAILVVACTVRPKVGDTGYQGTWGRGNERVRSTLALFRQGDRWLVRVGVVSDDRNWTIRCGWDGRCEERVGGLKVYDHRFSASLDPATGHLRVECVAKAVAPGREDVHYVDELVVEPGGKRLVALTVERDGRPLPPEGRPRREYEKIADGVADPPSENDSPAPPSRGAGGE